MNQSMVDESLWIEQSNMDDINVSHSPHSRYILVKPISPSPNEEQQDEHSGNLDTDNEALLKETSV